MLLKIVECLWDQFLDPFIFIIYAYLGYSICHFGLCGITIILKILNSPYLYSPVMPLDQVSTNIVPHLGSFATSQNHGYQNTGFFYVTLQHFHLTEDQDYILVSLVANWTINNDPHLKDEV